MRFSEEEVQEARERLAAKQAQRMLDAELRQSIAMVHRRRIVEQADYVNGVPAAMAPVRRRRGRDDWNHRLIRAIAISATIILTGWYLILWRLCCG